MRLLVSAGLIALAALAGACTRHDSRSAPKQVSGGPATRPESVRSEGDPADGADNEKPTDNEHYLGVADDEDVRFKEGALRGITKAFRVQEVTMEEYRALADQICHRKVRGGWLYFCVTELLCVPMPATGSGEAVRTVVFQARRYRVKRSIPPAEMPTSDR